MLKDGDFQHIELMMGTNQDEGKLALALVDRRHFFLSSSMYL